MKPYLFLFAAVLGIVVIATFWDWVKGIRTYNGAGPRSNTSSRQRAGERHSLVRRGNAFAKEGNFDEALEWWSRAAALGESDTWTALGLAAQKGGEPLLNIRTSFARAGKNGNGYAMLIAGKISEHWGDIEAKTGENPIPGLSNYYESAAAMYREAAETGANFHAMHSLADLSSKRGFNEESRTWRHRAWKAGGGDSG